MADRAGQQGHEAKPAGTVKMVGVLSGVAALSGLLIVGVFQFTAPFIDANREAMIERAIFNVVPGGVSKSAYAFENGGIGGDPALASFGERFYAVYSESGMLTGVALETSGQGYQDVIRILYGYDPSKQVVTGMTVLESKETPGLGDKIAKSPEFLANFDALDAATDPETDLLINAIAVVKYGKKENAWEIDGITGATISSKAIGAMLDRGLRESIPRLRPHLEELGKAPL
jgi:Na+-translocating ferredoxin:NAD+ oxidoreductase subunit G